MPCRKLACFLIILHTHQKHWNLRSAVWKFIRQSELAASRLLRKACTDNPHKSSTPRIIYSLPAAGISFKRGLAHCRESACYKFIFVNIINVFGYVRTWLRAVRREKKKETARDKSNDNPEFCYKLLPWFMSGFFLFACFGAKKYRKNNFNFVVVKIVQGIQTTWRHKCPVNWDTMHAVTWRPDLSGD